ncbi:MAG: NnrU family protein [Desulfobacteraceae bacterium]|nr:NnrU family protein [Desulfobacteraceae bacterium]
MKYLILAVLVTAWCALHSAMISPPVTEYLDKNLGDNFRYYRLFFNVVSALTLAPVAFFAYSVRTEPVSCWAGYMRTGQVFLLGLSALLFFLGARRYDVRQLLGLEQIKEGAKGKAIAHSGKLDTSGVLGVMRHPWYLAAMSFIWARDLDLSAIIVNVIFTAYLFIGTFLEERKLVMEFGEEYRAYQQRVSMFIPYNWLKSKLK